MKKLLLALLSAVLLFTLASCGGGDTYTIEIIIPAGNTGGFVYSEEEISPRRSHVTISAGAGISHTEVVLNPVEVQEENAYEPVELAQGRSVRIEAEKDAWFRIGVTVQNPSEHDIAVAVKVENVDIRIE